MEAFVLFGFLAIAGVLTGITWYGRNKSSRNLLLRGLIVLAIGGGYGIIWGSALRETAAGSMSATLALIGLLGNLLSMYTAVLASTLVRTAWAEGHQSPKSP